MRQLLQQRVRRVLQLHPEPACARASACALCARAPLGVCVFETHENTCFRRQDVCAVGPDGPLFCRENARAPHTHTHTHTHTRTATPARGVPPAHYALDAMRTSCAACGGGADRAGLAALVVLGIILIYAWYIILYYIILGIILYNIILYYINTGRTMRRWLFTASCSSSCSSELITILYCITLYYTTLHYITSHYTYRAGLAALVVLGIIIIFILYYIYIPGRPCGAGCTRRPPPPS